MADENGSAMDYEAHEKMYANFLVLVKYSTIATVIVLIAMAIFLL